MVGKGQRLDLAGAAALVCPRDLIACGFVSGQPTGVLGALGARDDLEDVVLYTGLLVEPHPDFRDELAASDPFVQSPPP